ncbi:ATP-binding cassette domain-containing protein [Candidatus Woesebacteria bacterium]|nr:ATP-binding cassette domain-containing protein [Candidatus Woesebacteria bacterium]QQG47925.1 MAG: ATP-binding cassette domain-containing protein [Candidatus Woesebacteria bacterium]
MIEFKGLTKTFGKIVALQDVTFKVDDGEFIFIVGPSGAGKTTLLKLLTREYKPTRGEILMDDVDIVKLKKKDIPLLRQKIGVVFQDFKLLPERTLRENIEIALAIKGVDKGQWIARVDQVLKLVGLSDRSDLFPAQLSGGEIQKASIARALVINPVCIFADEPTGNLDWGTADLIMDLLTKINKEGKTIIVTSHNKELVEKFGKRVIEMKNGKVIKDRNTK